jgi:putative DNA primase/helicase
MSADPWGGYNTAGVAEQAGADEMHRGQLRMAYRLAAAYEGRLLHVGNVGWFVWDGTRWAEDERGAASVAVFATLKAALTEAVDLASKLRDELLSDVRRCETAAGVDGVLKLASVLDAFAAVVSDLDADPYLLNTATGTLDLRTGHLRPADPGDRITKVTGAGYDPAATRCHVSCGRQTPAPIAPREVGEGGLFSLPVTRPAPARKQRPWPRAGGAAMCVVSPL